MYTKTIATILMTTTLATAPVFAKKNTPDKSFGSTIKNNALSAEEVKMAQESWGKALIQISKDFEKGGLSKATETATNILDQAYGYNDGPVLFKPTLTSGEQTFRTTKEGALAYFVGNNKSFPTDSGFALKGWEKFEYKNAAVYINGDVAMTMGNVILTDKKGNVTVVDKTWAFKKGLDGKIKIVLHHSSLPYQPKNMQASN